MFLLGNLVARPTSARGKLTAAVYLAVFAFFSTPVYANVPGIGPPTEDEQVLAALTKAQDAFIDATTYYIKACLADNESEACRSRMRNRLAEAARLGVSIGQYALKQIRQSQHHYEPAFALRLLDSITSRRDPRASVTAQCGIWDRLAQEPLPNGEIRTLGRLLADAKLEAPNESIENDLLTRVIARVSPCVPGATGD